MRSLGPTGWAGRLAPTSGTEIARLGVGGCAEAQARFDALLEHGEAEITIGADPDGAAQLRSVVDGYGNEIIGADGLGREIGADFGDGNRAVGSGRQSP